MLRVPNWINSRCQTGVKPLPINNIKNVVSIINLNILLNHITHGVPDVTEKHWIKWLGILNLDLFSFLCFLLHSYQTPTQACPGSLFLRTKCLSCSLSFGLMPECGPWQQVNLHSWQTPLHVWAECPFIRGECLPCSPSFGLFSGFDKCH